MRVYTVRIYLEASATPVWRTLNIDPRWTFHSLAEAFALSLQVPFGTYEFLALEEHVRITNSKELLAQQAFLKSSEGADYLKEAEERNFEVDHQTRIEDAEETPIVRYLLEEKEVRYLPHIEENWCYKIRLLGKEEAEIALLEGQGSAPQGYFDDQEGQELLWSVLTDPHHPDYEALRSWLDKEGVHIFDLEEARQSLKERWPS